MLTFGTIDFIMSSCNLLNAIYNRLVIAVTGNNLVVKCDLLCILEKL